MANMRLTVRTVEAVKPEEKDVILWDSEIPSFGLKVTPKGKRSFILFYRTADHTQRKPTIGSYPALKPEQARRIAQDMLADVRRGGDPSGERRASRATRAQGTVAELLPSFLEAKAHLRSIGEMERIFKKDILPAIGSRRAEDVKRSDITQLLDRIEKRAPALAKQVRLLLSNFYSWAMPRLSDSAVNPVVGAISISAPVARERWLSDAELKALWTVLETEKGPWKVALRMLILTGQRRSEVLEADWSEFDLGKAVWEIPAERAKNKKVHIVPLAPAVVEMLETIPHRVGRLFSGASQVSRHAKRIKEKLTEGMTIPAESWWWHDFRRTLATGMQRLGVRLEVTEAILNHISGTRAGVAGIYNRYKYEPDKRAALNAWDVRLREMFSTMRTSIADQ